MSNSRQSKRSRDPASTRLGKEIESEIFAKIESPNGYFMPFLGEHDPTYSMMFKKEDNSKYANQHIISPFKPKNNPETNFIGFALEVATYIQKYQNTGGISREQYADLLFPHFSFSAWQTLKVKKANEMLLAYANTHYHWEQRRHDFRSYRLLPEWYHYGSRKSHFNDVYYAYTADPSTRLTMLLYEAPMSVVEQVLREYFYLFNEAGFPVHANNMDIVDIIKEADGIRESEHSDPPMALLPLFRRRDHGDAAERDEDLKRKRPGPSLSPPNKKRLALPGLMWNTSVTSEEWNEGQPKEECINLWERIPNVPPRTFQSFKLPSSWKSRESRITEEERLFRFKYKLCSYCGNHLNSNKSAKHVSHPFYKIDRTKRQADSQAPSTSDIVLPKGPSPPSESFDHVSLARRFMKAARNAPRCVTLEGMIILHAGKQEIIQASVATSCRLSLITVPMAKRLSLPIHHSSETIPVMARWLDASTTVSTYTIIHFQLDNLMTLVIAYIIPSEDEELILGIDWLSNYNVTVSC